MANERSRSAATFDKCAAGAVLVDTWGPSKDAHRDRAVYPAAVMNDDPLDQPAPIHSDSSPSPTASPSSDKSSAAPTADKPNPRKENKIVEAYLIEVERKAGQPKGKSPQQLRQELTSLSTLLKTVEGIEKLEILQQRENLYAEMRMAEEGALDSMEAAFIEVANSYGERKGISYSTWREFGVPKGILEQAGIKRTRRPYPIEDPIED